MANISSSTQRVVLCAGAAFALAAPHALAADSAPVELPAHALDGIPDLTRPHDETSLLVRFDTNADQHYIDTIIAAAEAEIEWRYTIVPGLVCLQLNQSVQDTLVFLHNFGDVVTHLSPDYTYSINTEPNDPDFEVQWALKNTRQIINNARGFLNADTDATDAWDIFTGSSDFVVGVVDQGTYLIHEDLEDNIWVNPGEIPGNNIDDDNNGYIDDVNGWDFTTNSGSTIGDLSDSPVHGTLVSSIIAAETNNGVGIAGVNWHAKIMPLKFIDFTGSGPNSLAIQAIEYAVMMGVPVTNHSWGAPFFDINLSNAIDAAQQQGHVIVAAAGNSGAAQADYPARYSQDNVVSVASIDNRDNIASSSQYNAVSVDLGAPGVGIYGAVPPTGNPSGYGFVNGTSFAAPHVSGAISLVWSYRPNWTYQQVINQVLSTTRPIPSLMGKTVTGGALNIGDALASAFLPPTINHTPESSIVPPGQTITLFATLDSGDDVYSGSGALNYRFNCGPWMSLPLDASGQASIPAPHCGDQIQYYFSAQAATAGTITFPDQSTLQPPIELSVGGTFNTIVSDSFTTDTGWTSGSPDDTNISPFGNWERTNPMPTPAQPGAGSDDAYCLVTDGRDNGSLGAYDVDTGTTSIVSPQYNLAGVSQVVVTFDHWLSNDLGTNPGVDPLVAQVSNDGGVTWTTALTIGPSGTQASAGWFTSSFNFDDHLQPTANSHIRFVAQDSSAVPSVVEAAIDRFKIEGVSCIDSVYGLDVNSDGNVDVSDINAMHAAVNSAEPMADHDRSGTVDMLDILSYLNSIINRCP